MSGSRVLVLGEEQIVLKDLSACLGNIGYSITAAPADEEEAFHLLAGKKPDIVFINMRPRSGFDAVQAGREIARSFRVPVVFLTQHTDSGHMDESKRNGTFAFLEKPFSQKRLRIVLESVLA